MLISDYIRECHETAESKGWWQEPVRTFGDQIALMHSELSEALEEFRKYGIEKPDSDGASNTLYFGDGPSNPSQYPAPGTKPEGIAAELADVCIRIFDTCGHYGIPLEEALRLKMAYNKTRAHKHGGKVI
jgi:NTP pyrophosphatase (non-canonical NTP hydrolase)